MGKPKLSDITRPSTRASARTSKAAAARHEQGVSRLAVNLPEMLHRKLKKHAIDAGKSVRDVVIELIERNIPNAH